MDFPNLTETKQSREWIGSNAEFILLCRFKALVQSKTIEYPERDFGVVHPKLNTSQKRVISIFVFVLFSLPQKKAWKENEVGTQ